MTEALDKPKNNLKQFQDHYVGKLDRLLGGRKDLTVALNESKEALRENVLIRFTSSKGDTVIFDPNNLIPALDRMTYGVYAILTQLDREDLAQQVLKKWR